MHIPIKSGILIPVLILLPNLIWWLLPHPAANSEARVPLWLNMAENLGRIAIIGIPCFYSLSFGRRFSSIALVVACLALALYYVTWLRYFAGGRTAALMKAPLLGIPIPLAVTPDYLLLLSSAYLLGSWPMLAASIVFGIAHIWLSALTL